jgi:hypothetical protein
VYPVVVSREDAALWCCERGGSHCGTVRRRGVFEVAAGASMGRSEMYRGGCGPCSSVWRRHGVEIRSGLELDLVSHGDGIPEVWTAVETEVLVLVLVPAHGAGMGSLDISCVKGSK